MGWFKIAIALPLILMTIGDTAPRPEQGSGTLEIQRWSTERDIAFELERSDAAKVMLLDRLGIINYPDWRDEFDLQFMGYGVRSAVVDMDRADVERLKALLLDSSNYVKGIKACGTEGDAAIVLQGPKCEVKVFLELWCGRVSFRHWSGRGLGENCDPIRAELIELVLKYFPKDEYLLGLKAKK